MEARCVTIENISSKKTYLQLRFVLTNKDLKSMVRRINLRLILLNQFKEILDELFKILRRQCQPTLVYLKTGFHCLLKSPFSWFAQVIAWVSLLLACHANASNWSCPLQESILFFNPDIKNQCSNLTRLLFHAFK